MAAVVETLPVMSPYQFTTNCYVAAPAPNSARVVVIDPAGELPSILEVIGGRTLAAIIVTHRHDDHLGALKGLVEKTSAPVYAHCLDATAIEERCFPPARDRGTLGLVSRLDEGDTVTCDTLTLTVLHTPGHTIGSMCLYSAPDKLLFSGDTIFRGTTGRTDLPTGSPSEMAQSLIKLSALPDDVTVYPGHDAPTTIAFERTRALVEYRL
ncbi:MAG: MBL fold metallo-hydrolase [Coriobacteriales bacterium]|jgi:glyoxylase-like metal-dependent hydrolase (beta-lactamase superfamily II)|nr:MBL fold metallo-hydrolase [Coriobacteriales bacterium]